LKLSNDSAKCVQILVQRIARFINMLAIQIGERTSAVKRVCVGVWGCGLGARPRLLKHFSASDGGTSVACRSCQRDVKNASQCQRIPKRSCTIPAQSPHSPRTVPAVGPSPHTINRRDHALHDDLRLLRNCDEPPECLRDRCIKCCCCCVCLCVLCCWLFVVLCV
jgi:hypothetical protein